MQETMKYLCENIQNIKFSYCQSDEISLLLTDYENINTAAWFDFQVQKMCSIAASMATLAFNRAFKDEVEYVLGWAEAESLAMYHAQVELTKPHIKALEKGAMIDARCFSIPKE